MFVLRRTHKAICIFNKNELPHVMKSFAQFDTQMHLFQMFISRTTPTRNKIATNKANIIYGHDDDIVKLICEAT